MKAERARERLEQALRFEALGDAQKAERAYRAIVRRHPRDAQALTRLGLLLSRRNEFAEAASLFRRAGEADPQSFIAQMNLAAALLRLGDEPGAVVAYAAALAIDPSSREARLNLAYRLRRLGRLVEARPHYQHLVARQPRDSLARWNLAALDGLAGDLDAAFAGFAHDHALKSADLPLRLPRWRGEPLAGRRLLLEAEQGLGDTIMFARLAPLAHAAGGRVILRAQPQLQGLVAQIHGVEAFASREQPEPEADLWAPLADLPAVFGAAACIAAAPRPYLTAEPGRAATWAARLPDTAKMRVGLVWAGGAAHPEDADRSMPLSTMLQPLAAIDGVELVSLQKGPPAAQADGSDLIRADLDIADFEDTAAALDRMDLLICVDTSILHLAGALGRPVWGLIGFVPDWRWMLNRTDSPWYPSLRLFRQPTPGDWRSAVAAVAVALSAAVRAGG